LKTLNKFTSKIGGTQQAAESVAPKLEDVLAQAKQEFEVKLAASDGKVEKVKEELTHDFERKVLNLTHRDWNKLVRDYDANGKDVGLNPEFAAWVATKPAADQDKLLNGWDALFTSEKLTEYKDHLKKTAEASKKQVAPATPGRLKTAVQTQGIPGQVSTKTALQEQMEGYSQA